MAKPIKDTPALTGYDAVKYRIEEIKSYRCHKTL